ncbi:apolipoprotein N-acyltransferase [Candidatus Electronema sp. TJ]|uniref:apolipoprotein N-acyltransferase n=1 Tax=Candidatus Electronema sp. TJ TaxID=3401573 RepID=UPI003AA8568A
MSDEKPLNRILTLAAPAASALLLTLAMPGLTGWWPLLFVALLPLLWAARQLSPSQSVCMGMACGILYHAGLMYWIVFVLNHYGGMHAAVAAAAMLLLAAYMAGYMGFFCWAISRLTGGPGQGSASVILLTAPALWVGLDVVKGFLFSGLPWMDLGCGLHRQPLLIQSADLGGHHLVTFCVVQINALIFWLADRMLNRSRAKELRRHSLYPLAVFLLLYCVGGYSMFRWRQIEATAASAGQAVVTVVQGNIDQSEKWSPAHKEETVRKYLALSKRNFRSDRPMDLLVWPETALPFYPSRDTLMHQVRGFARDRRVHMLVGAPYFTVLPEKKRPVEFFNSALMLDSDGRLTERYNKQHLVPFGEYVPLRDYLWFVKPLVELIGDFIPGTSSDPMEAEQIKAGTLICFESIFPEIARKTVAQGANLLVNLTNDAWYGRSSAPHQSWAMTVMRAVENRRSVARAANTGISGFVAPTGAVIAESALFEDAALTESVPLLTEQTFFVKGGHWFGHVCLALSGIFLLINSWLTRKQRKRGGGKR